MVERAQNSARQECDVVWNGEIVGTMSDITIDNFHVEGRWKAADSPAIAPFIEALSAEDAVVIVEIGGMRARACAVPGDFFEATAIPGL